MGKNGTGMSPVLVLLLGLGMPASASDTSGELAIEAGRLQAMLGKTETLLKLTDNEEVSPTTDTVRQTDDPFILLKDAVIRYDRDLSEACARNAITGPICNDLLAPYWLASRTVPPRADLATMIEGVSRHITPFWKEACRVGGKGSDDSLCEIE